MAKDKVWRPDLTKAWVTWSYVGFGQIVYVCYVPDFAAPIGLVWGQPCGNGFAVMGSYVPEWVRRMGVRTRINTEIFLHYKVIVTEHGSKEGGAAFLRARSYQKHKVLGLFYLPKPKERKRKPRGGER